VRRLPIILAAALPLLAVIAQAAAGAEPPLRVLVLFVAVYLLGIAGALAVLRKRAGIRLAVVVFVFAVALTILVLSDTSASSHSVVAEWLNVPVAGEPAQYHSGTAEFDSSGALNAVNLVAAGASIVALACCLWLVAELTIIAVRKRPAESAGTA
jgi:hypothetical protein